MNNQKYKNDINNEVQRYENSYGDYNMNSFKSNEKHRRIESLQNYLSGLEMYDDPPTRTRTANITENENENSFLGR